MYNEFMKSLISLFLLLFSCSLYSLDSMEYITSDPVAYLGMQPSEAWERVGSPESIGVTGNEEGPVIPISLHQDGGVILYWLNDRVWQVSFQAPWDGAFWGLELDMEKSLVEETLGSPFLDTADWSLYKLPDIGFPVEGRFFYDEQGLLVEFYFYRSDY